MSKDNPSEIWAKLRNLCNPPSTRAALQIVREDESISSDVKEVLARWHKDISNLFSGLRQNPNFAFDDKFYEEILEKKTEFEKISQISQPDHPFFAKENLNAELSFDEVSTAIDRAKSRKAFLEIPNEAMKNKNAKLLLHKFFNLCFQSGLSPSEWDTSDIKPIPKKDKDSRDPLQNRCITIMCCVAKIYSGILNRRLQKYLEKNNLLADEQNGFRASRSCLDHVLVLCTVLRNRKSAGLNTFLSFIDFQKAFDSVDRGLLLYKLSQMGISGNFYNAINAMYSNPQSRVILNENETEYFKCPIGVKQGDSISATLFAIYINDLVKEIRDANVGINLNLDLDFENSVFINILAYADDIVLLATNETDLQFLLFIVEKWCSKWRLEVNLSKTNVMHVRGKRDKQSIFMFIFNKRLVSYCNSYKYLGVTLDEFLDYNFTADTQAESAGRALGSLIAKAIKCGGLPYKIYSMLFECCCTSVSDYGAEIWGFQSREGVSKIHLRAARSFLGVPKNTTSVAILAEINWLEPVNRAQIRMVRQYFRVNDMNDNRLTKKIINWDKNFSRQFPSISTWYSEVQQIFENHNILNYFEKEGKMPSLLMENLKQSMLVKQTVDLQSKCNLMPKLRTYTKFMEFGKTPAYLLKPLSFVQKMFLAKTRLAALPLRLETGRYERPRLPEQDRLCPSCKVSKMWKMRNTLSFFAINTTF